MNNKKDELPPGKDNSEALNLNTNNVAQPNKGNLLGAALKRAKEFLNENPSLSKNDLDKKLRNEGLPAGSSQLELIYHKHRRNLTLRN